MQQCSILNLKLYFCHQDDKELFDNQTYANFTFSPTDFTLSPTDFTLSPTDFTDSHRTF